MSKDPYKVLGVSPKADDEAIKKAYHELARKYHPDRYTNSDLADLASEKMKEVNAAYEEIQRMRAEGEAPREEQRYSSDGAENSAYGSQNSQQNGQYQGNGGAYQTTGAGNYKSQNYSAYAREKFIAIRNCINQGNIPEAERLIYEVSEQDRGAEWHFLLGCIQLRKGFYVDAQYSFDTAYRMEPTNNEYWQFKERMHERAKNYGGGYDTGRRSSGGCCDCDTCTTLCVMDACCECMGGNLIPCC